MNTYSQQLESAKRSIDTAAEGVQEFADGVRNLGKALKAVPVFSPCCGAKVDTSERVLICPRCRTKI